LALLPPFVLLSWVRGFRRLSFLNALGNASLVLGKPRRADRRTLAEPGEHGTVVREEWGKERATKVSDRGRSGEGCFDGMQGGGQVVGM
jgi:hypothetical protein